MCILAVGPFIVKLYVMGALVGSLVADLIAVALKTDNSLTVESNAELFKGRGVATVEILSPPLSLLFYFVSFFFTSFLLL